MPALPGSRAATPQPSSGIFAPRAAAVVPAPALESIGVPRRPACCPRPVGEGRQSEEPCPVSFFWPSQGAHSSAGCTLLLGVLEFPPRWLVVIPNLYGPAGGDRGTPRSSALGRKERWTSGPHEGYQGLPLSLQPQESSSESSPDAQSQGVRAVTRTASPGGRRCRTPAHKMAPAPSCQLTHSGALAALEIRSGLDAPLPRLCLMTHPTLGNNRTEAPGVLVLVERAAASAVPHLEGRREGGCRTDLSRTFPGALRCRGPSCISPSAQLQTELTPPTPELI